MKDIIIKKILDSQGSFHHLELWQDGRYIEVSLGSTALDSGSHSYKWGTLKKLIDGLYIDSSRRGSSEALITVKGDNDGKKVH